MIIYREIKIGVMLFMENTPTIILFWLFIIIIFILMLVSMMAAIILLKKGKMPFVGKICLTLSTICSIPILFVVGYILYVYIT